MLDAMDEVRKAEQKELKSKKYSVSRKLLMIPEAKQTEEQSLKITELLKQYPKTGRAYRMVQAVDMLYASKTMQEAEVNFHKLHQWMRKNRLAPIKRAADTLKRYRDEILNYFRSRITNAICEGFNSMIQAAKRKARGYPPIRSKVFSSIIYFVTGNLNLACFIPLR